MSGRLARMDALRALAVFLVLGHHWRQFVSDSSCPVISAIFRSGWVGVDLFFVLSGFLVSGLLFKEYQKHGSINLRRFFIRRGLKIYPGFYVMIFATLVVAVMGPDRNSFNFDALLIESVFVQNYVYGAWNHTWSLAVEEHFYLGLGFLMSALVRFWQSKNPFQKVVYITLGACLVCTALRTATHLIFGYDWMNVYAATHLRVDSLLFGVWLSYSYHFNRKRFLEWTQRNRRRVLVASLVLASTCIVFSQQSLVMVGVGVLCLYIGFGGLVSLAVADDVSQTTRKNSWLVRALAYVGQHSYSIYLWHMPVLIWSPDAVELLTGIDMIHSYRALVYALGSVLFGIAMAKAIEVPVLRIRDRLYPSRSSAVA